MEPHATRVVTPAHGARVITPEAVVLDVRTAGLGSRALARLLDGLIQGAALIVLLLITGIFVASSVGGVLGTAGRVIDLVLITAIIFAYPIIWESLWRGRTPGKAALGLRVVTRQGAPIRFRHALVRGLIGLVEVIALSFVGVISMLLSPNDQRLGDMAAGTLVIRERAPGPMSMPIVFYSPAGWEPFVASLDVSGVAASEYEILRSFLIRARQMAPAARWNLAARLAAPLAARMGQPVPPSAGPELWLACVASAYQRRHGVPILPPPPWWRPPHPATRMGGAWGPPAQASTPGVPGPPAYRAPGSPAYGVPGPPAQASAPGMPGPPAPVAPARSNPGFTAPD